jgi:hypothetical protein
MEAADQRGSMVYFGAGWDLWPVIRYAMFVKEFIYVDGLPNSKYYKEKHAGFKYSKDEESLIASVKQFAPGGVRKLEKVRDSVYRFDLNGGVTLTYYINTPYENWAKTQGLKESVEKAQYLYLSGFSPDQFNFRDMPNLKQIISTPPCLEDFPVEMLRSFAKKIRYIEDVEDVFHEFGEMRNEIGDQRYVVLTSEGFSIPI